MIRYFLFIFYFSVHLCAFAQKDSGRIMTSFRPESNAYDIYHPKNFLLREDTAGIVTITDSNSGLNITISSFSLDESIDDEALIERMTVFMSGYFNKEIKREQWNSYKTRFDAVVELLIDDITSNWVWYGIVDNKGLVVISLNKKEAMRKEDMELIRYMINSLIIAN